MVDPKPNTGLGNSPDRQRMSTYRKAAEEAIQQYRTGMASRSAFGSAGAAFGMTNGGGPMASAPPQYNNNANGGSNMMGTRFGGPTSSTTGGGQNVFDMGRR